MRLLPSALALLLATALPLTAAPAAGQSCAPGDGAWVGLEAGAVHHDVAGGTGGLEWGVGAGIGSRLAAARVSVYRTELSGAPATPTTVRLAAHRSVLELGAWRLCATLHAAGSRFTTESDRGSVLAGGAGMGVARALVLAGIPVTPFLEGRGLGARSEATILDMDTEATGFSLGVEAGAAAALGRALIRVTGSLDGFAPGLGATPYPARALRLGLAYRF